MVKETITYTDYNDVERTEDFYFNFTEAEIAEMELSVDGGFTTYIKKISDAKNVPAVAALFKDFILKAYGEKSADGKRFIKNDEIRESFVQCPAYSILYMQLAQDADKATTFVNALAPKQKKASAMSVPNK